MNDITDILRHRHGLGLTRDQIAAAVGVSSGTVSHVLERAAAAGLNPRSRTRSSIASSTTLIASTSRASPSESATSRRRSTAATTSEGARPGGRVHGRLRRRPGPNRRGARRHAEWRSLPPRPQPLYSAIRARLRSHRAGLRPAPNVAKEVETPAPVPGETARQRDRPPSNHAGFAVKCRQNLRQVRQNKQTARVTSLTTSWPPGSVLLNPHDVNVLICGRHVGMSWRNISRGSSVPSFISRARS